MYIFYVIAILPIIIGGILWAINHEIEWKEWAIGSVVAIFIAGCFHSFAIFSMTTDIETWSGEITSATYYPKWVEQYYITHYTHDSKGNVTGSYTTTHYRTHHEYWESYSNIGTSYEISHKKYDEMKEKFNSQIDKNWCYKDGFYSGDHHVYTIINQTKENHYPITTIKMWDNRIKAAPSVFSYPKIDNPKIPEWPKNDNPWRSDRLIGDVGQITIKEWDKLNSYLGPKKKVNVILVGFGKQDSSESRQLEAKWIGGKKNDLVITFGMDENKATWAYVFGWSESELAKRNLESLILENPINNDLLPKIRNEIESNYQIKDWSKFDYITIEPTATMLIWYIVILLLSQGGLYWYFYEHELDGGKTYKW